MLVEEREARVEAVNKLRKLKNRMMIECQDLRLAAEVVVNFNKTLALNLETQADTIEQLLVKAIADAEKLIPSP